MAHIIYQSFVLDENKQRKADKLRSQVGSQKGGIDKKRGRKLIDFLKTKYTVFVSNATFAGVHTIIMVGAELSRAGSIKTDFGKKIQELGLYFVSGAFFTEAV